MANSKRTMGRDETLLNNFVTVTKRMPLKARVVLALSIAIVIIELASGIIGSEHNLNPKIALNTNSDIGKFRERKEVRKDDMNSIEDINNIEIVSDNKNLIKSVERRSIDNPESKTVEEEMNEVDNAITKLSEESKDVKKSNISSIVTKSTYIRFNKEVAHP
ncbi:uncharacterized protein LOC130612081 [Hydractinia symbiolongicarpus]|uniref:uncharacterized protein LOC130612081 n=1 Tax=Hydractinia symbiolongicarpus TaxID=13093 RepID=UPI00254F290A|nr:uncharacterized protein LOC130612081 [Hydractinia symbiolongicarpus]